MADRLPDVAAAATLTRSAVQLFDILRQLPPDVVHGNILEHLQSWERRNLKSTCRAGRTLVTSCLARLSLQTALLPRDEAALEEQVAALERYTGVSTIYIELKDAYLTHQYDSAFYGEREPAEQLKQLLSLLYMGRPTWGRRVTTCDVIADMSWVHLCSRLPAAIAIGLPCLSYLRLHNMAADAELLQPLAALSPTLTTLDVHFRTAMRQSEAQAVLAAASSITGLTTLRMDVEGLREGRWLASAGAGIADEVLPSLDLSPLCALQQLYSLMLRMNDGGRADDGWYGPHWLARLADAHAQLPPGLVDITLPFAMLHDELVEAAGALPALVQLHAGSVRTKRTSASAAAAVPPSAAATAAQPYSTVFDIMFDCVKAADLAAVVQLVPTIADQVCLTVHVDDTTTHEQLHSLAGLYGVGRYLRLSFLAFSRGNFGKLLVGNLAPLSPNLTGLELHSLHRGGRLSQQLAAEICLCSRLRDLVVSGRRMARGFVRGLLGPARPSHLCDISLNLVSSRPQDATRRTAMTRITPLLLCATIAAASSTCTASGGGVSSSNGSAARLGGASEDLVLRTNMLGPLEAANLQSELHAVGCTHVLVHGSGPDPAAPWLGAPGTSSSDDADSTIDDGGGGIGHLGAPLAAAAGAAAADGDDGVDDDDDGEDDDDEDDEDEDDNGHE